MADVKARQDYDAIQIFDGMASSTQGRGVLTPELMDRIWANQLKAAPEGSLMRENLDKAFKFAKETLFGP